MLGDTSGLDQGMVLPLCGHRAQRLIHGRADIHAAHFDKAGGYERVMVALSDCRVGGVHSLTYGPTELAGKHRNHKTEPVFRGLCRERTAQVLTAKIVGLLGPVVVGDNGHHAVVQSEDRHEDKALELEVGAKHSGGGGGEGDEDSVDPEDHHRAQCTA